jgi:hypothetical protein
MSMTSAVATARLFGAPEAFLARAEMRTLKPGRQATVDCRRALPHGD